MSHAQLRDRSTIHPDSSDARWCSEGGEETMVVWCVVDVEKVLAWSAEGDADAALRDGGPALGDDGGLVYVVPLDWHGECRVEM
jgi:hypothetical protein